MHNVAWKEMVRNVSGSLCAFFRLLFMTCVWTFGAKQKTEGKAVYTYAILRNPFYKTVTYFEFDFALAMRMNQHVELNR